LIIGIVQMPADAVAAIGMRVPGPPAEAPAGQSAGRAWQLLLGHRSLRIRFDSNTGMRLF
jgi:hypothetical protein